MRDATRRLPLVSCLVIGVALIACAEPRTNSSDASVVVDAGDPPKRFLIGGRVSGLMGAGLIVRLVSYSNDPDEHFSEELPVNEDRAFVFERSVRAGNEFGVGVAHNPPNQVCSVLNDDGIVTDADVNDIEVTCVPGYSVGGTVSGLPPDTTVTLQNRATWDTTPLQNQALVEFVTVGNGPFTFDALLSEGTNYTITVKQQPPRQTCTVTPSSPQIVEHSDVNDVVVSCGCNNAFVRENDACVGSYVSVVPGSTYSCGVRTNGTLWCWGGYAQSGLASAPHRLAPVQVGTDSDWSEVRLGERGSCGLKPDRTLWCWGSVGDVGHETYSYVPAQIGAKTWATVAIGSAHTCGVRTDGTLWCWGLNGNGQLGDGTTTHRALPVQVGTATNWTAVSAGQVHTCGLRADGSLWCWGNSSYGQLGDRDSSEMHSPVRVGSSRTWSVVAVGNLHSCAIATDGTLWCWGDNDHGQLGDGATTNRNAPHQVGTDSAWTTLTAGAGHTCAMDANRDIWCWGFNGSGAIGNGNTIDQTSPVMADHAGDWSSILAGAYHTCGTRRDGTHWCWGANEWGELGDGTEYNSSSPVQVIEPP